MVMVSIIMKIDCDCGPKNKKRQRRWAKNVKSDGWPWLDEGIFSPLCRALKDITYIITIYITPIPKNQDVSLIFSSIYAYGSVDFSHISRDWVYATFNSSLTFHDRIHYTSHLLYHLPTKTQQRKICISMSLEVKLKLMKQA